jgi:hypothetical protein
MKKEQEDRKVKKIVPHRETSSFKGLTQRAHFVFQGEKESHWSMA